MKTEIGSIAHGIWNKASEMCCENIPNYRRREAWWPPALLCEIGEVTRLYTSSTKRYEGSTYSE